MSSFSSNQSSFVIKNAKPFLKWVGGKQQLLKQLEIRLPKNFNRYFEPFLGGGATFFHLFNIDKLPSCIFLFDNNEELINTYNIVRNALDKLFKLLEKHQTNHSREYYYQIRDLDRRNISMTDVERAARTIYLNRTCYNGLYRVNSKKQFNVPIGSYKHPKILFKDVLEVASLSLQNACIQIKDFREIVLLAQPGDFFYFDPPYVPVSKTSNFTGYTANSFSYQDQLDLSNVFKRLTEKGCFCMLSNSYTPLITELYRDFNIGIVQARRAVNSDAAGRGIINEVIVLNYDTYSCEQPVISIPKQDLSSSQVTIS